jgi:hypothetical protein
MNLAAHLFATLKSIQPDCRLCVSSARSCVLSGACARQLIIFYSMFKNTVATGNVSSHWESNLFTKSQLNPLNAELNPICHLLTLLGDLTFMGPCIVKYIPTYIQQDATLHSLFIAGNCSTCFEFYFHTSSGARTTVSTASGICQTVTATCRYSGR